MDQKLTANELQERALAKGEPEYINYDGDANMGGYLAGICPRCKQPIVLNFTNGGKLSPKRTLRLDHVFSGSALCEKPEVLEQIKEMTGQQKMEFFIKKHDDEVRSEAGLVNIYINGKTEMVCAGSISFEKICALAQTSEWASVTYRHRVPFGQLTGERQGILSRGQSVPVTLDMVINAIVTGNA